MGKHYHKWIKQRFPTDIYDMNSFYKEKKIAVEETRAKYPFHLTNSNSWMKPEVMFLDDMRNNIFCVFVIFFCKYCPVSKYQDILYLYPHSSLAFQWKLTTKWSFASSMHMCVLVKLDLQVFD